MYAIELTWTEYDIDGELTEMSLLLSKTRDNSGEEIEIITFETIEDAQNHLDLLTLHKEFCKVIEYNDC